MPNTNTYKIVRFFASRRRYTVQRHLTIDEAMDHCNDPETSSSTAKSKTARQRTRRCGDWFDGWVRE